MGDLFTCSQIYNDKNLEKEKFLDFFKEKMKSEGFIDCNRDESELSYILKFADNSNWVTVTSEEYEPGSIKTDKDAGRIAKMLGTSCINTSVIDSDCAVMNLFDKSGKKVDSLIMGRADDYFGDNIPLPVEKKWSAFLSDNSSWKQLLEVRNGEYVFVEEGLSKLALLLGMDVSNITFSSENVRENDETVVFLDFKKEEVKGAKKLTLNTAFKQIFKDALEPYGFKFIKGKHPYMVRVVNDEILHIITYCEAFPEYPMDKAFELLGGVATIYRKRISLDKSPKQNYNWLFNVFIYHNALMNVFDPQMNRLLYKSRYYSDNNESLISAVQEAVERTKKYLLPVFDKANDIDSCMDYMKEFRRYYYTNRIEEIRSYYSDEDEEFLIFMSEKVLSEKPTFLYKYFKDIKFHEMVDKEIESRKTENLEILRGLKLIE